MDNLYFIWNKGEKLKLSNNFNSAEFECKCKNSECIEQRISKDLIEGLQKVRTEHNKSITVTSGYRCLKHNRAIGSSDTSQHPLGNGGDITSSDLNGLYSVCEKHFKAVGDGRTKRKFIHVDSRNDKIRRWDY
jgi:uncharacterized protein YcbK (DUF882 family)